MYNISLLVRKIMLQNNFSSSISQKILNNFEKYYFSHILKQNIRPNCGIAENATSKFELL